MNGLGNRVFILKQNLKGQFGRLGQMRAEREMLTFGGYNAEQYKVKEL